MCNLKKNKKNKPIVTKLFIRDTQLNIYPVFKTKCNTFYHENTKLKEIGNNLSDPGYKDLKLYKDYTKVPFSFLVNDITILSDNPLKSDFHYPKKWYLLQ